jgi:hypothetical protein
MANVPARHPRVHLLYHTPLQVAVGAGNGFVFAIAWYCFVTQVGPKHFLPHLYDLFCVSQYLVPKFPALAKSKVLEYFYVKDNTRVPGILRFEWETSRLWPKDE